MEEETEEEREVERKEKIMTTAALRNTFPNSGSGFRALAARTGIMGGT